ncbi:RNHCP domain-containing protein [Streptomycetaceae bacterium NBC_01309]
MPRRNSASGTRATKRRKAVRPPGGERGDSFRCVGCRLDVPLRAPGTAHRNHCPHCLASRHVDGRTPGDRSAECRAPMAALTVGVRENGEWMLVHQCRGCGTLRANRIAGDDNPVALMRLAVRPLAGPHFTARARSVWGAAAAGA